MKIKAIVAMSRDRVIGAKGDLPWHISEDLKRVKKLTMGDTVLMGRKNYESIPEKYRPLSGRKNVVVTRQNDWIADESVLVFRKNPTEVIEELSKEAKADDVLWVFGGGEIYEQTIDLWDEIYLTLVEGEYEGDVFFPEFEEDFEETWQESHEGFSFINYSRI